MVSLQQGFRIFTDDLKQVSVVLIAILKVLTSLKNVCCSVTTGLCSRMFSPKYIQQVSGIFIVGLQVSTVLIYISFSICGRL